MRDESENNRDTLFDKLKILENRITELESAVYAINWVLIEKYHRFFNEYLSTFYEFDEKDLVKFYKQLTIGNEYSEPDIDFEPLGVGQARYGLAFNRNIIWSTILLNSLLTRE